MKKEERGGGGGGEADGEGEGEGKREGKNRVFSKLFPPDWRIKAIPTLYQSVMSLKP